MLCIDPHPVLRKKARRIEAVTNEIRRLAREMIETMYAHDGIGLAAPQIGEDLQLFVANPSQRRGQEVVVINPVLEASRGRTAITEGCLSLPQIWERVTRAAQIRLTGQDVRGKPLTMETGGLLAIVLQHEVDHLQGRLFIDRLSIIRRVRVAVYRKFAGAHVLQASPAHQDEMSSGSPSSAMTARSG